METKGTILNIGGIKSGMNYRKQDFTLLTDEGEKTFLLFNRVEWILPHKVGDNIKVLYNHKAGVNYVNHLEKASKAKANEYRAYTQPDNSIKYWITHYDEAGTPILNTGEPDIESLGF